MLQMIILYLQNVYLRVYKEIYSSIKIFYLHLKQKISLLKIIHTIKWICKILSKILFIEGIKTRLYVLRSIWTLNDVIVTTTIIDN